MKLATPVAATLLPACATTPDYLPEESIAGIDGGVPLVRCQRPKLRMPESAFRRYRAMHATTTLRIVVMSDGTIGEVSIAKSSEDDDLDRAAVRASKALKCNPLPQGQTATALMTYTFDLR